MDAMRLEQAIRIDRDGAGPRILAKSSGFLDAWLPEVERICAAFGQPPVGAKCPQALFVQPLGSKHVAIVQVGEVQERLAFRVLVSTKAFYADLLGDPFLINATFPANFGPSLGQDLSTNSELPVLAWTVGPPALRSVAEVRRILDVEPDRTALLLGGVQALIDGSKLVIVQAHSDEKIVRDFWGLLPNAERCEKWPATFAYANTLGFHLLVTPDAAGKEFERYCTEEMARDYPEGRYEYALHKAADDNDQAEVEALFARRSRRQAFQLALVLLLVFILGALFMRVDIAPQDNAPAKADPKGQKQEKLP
jgi:hypothetical protein